MNYDSLKHPCECGCGTLIFYGRFIRGHNRKGKGPTNKDLITCFNEKYKIVESGCWLWQGALYNNGYAAFRNGLAHRVSFRLFKGNLKDSEELDHTCNNRNCVNPEHLRILSRRENTLRGNSFAAVNARKTHCPKGHPYDEQNTVIDNGKRKCLICKRNCVNNCAKMRRVFETVKKCTQK